MAPPEAELLLEIQSIERRRGRQVAQSIVDATRISLAQLESH